MFCTQYCKCNIRCQHGHIFTHSTVYSNQKSRKLKLQLENILRLIYHVAVCPPQFHTTVGSEQSSISAVNRVEGWQWKVGPGVWRVQQLMNGAHSPPEDFKRARINQPGGAPVAEPCPPAVSPEVSDAPSVPSHTTGWLTHWPRMSQLDYRRTQTEEGEYHKRLPKTSAPLGS